MKSLLTSPSLLVPSLLVAAFGIAACSSDTDSDPSPEATGGTATGGTSSTGGTAQGGTPTGTGGAPSNPTGNDLIGSFKVTLKAPTPTRVGYTEVLGSVYERPYPEDTIWDVTRTEGLCTLTEPRVPFCDPVCTGGQICVEGGGCEPTPSKKSVGSVTVRGMHTASGANEFMLTAVGGTYQPASDVGTLPYPGFDAGAPVTVSTSGGDFAPFTLEAPGIEPLEVTTAEPVRVAPNEPVPLAWDAPADPTTSKIEIKLEISHHGGVKGEITCNVPDSGSFTIPGSLVADLIALGVAGFPTIGIVRLSTDEAAVSAGRVELLLVSAVEKGVSIPGLVSCNDVSECEPGQECTQARKCE